MRKILFFSFLIAGFVFLKPSSAKAQVNGNDLSCAAVMCLFGRTAHAGPEIVSGKQPLCEPATKYYFSIRRWNPVLLFSVPPFYDPISTMIARGTWLAECISADFSADAAISLAVNAAYGTFFVDPGAL